MAISNGLINRRNALGVTLVGVSTVSAGLAKAQRPNILYINSHDTGRYTQPYGHAITGSEPAKAGGGGHPVPPSLLRRAYLFPQPGRAADRTEPEQERHVGPGSSRIPAQ